jgi:hypothetical protein
MSEAERLLAMVEGDAICAPFLASGIGGLRQKVDEGTIKTRTELEIAYLGPLEQYVPGDGGLGLGIKSQLKACFMRACEGQDGAEVMREGNGRRDAKLKELLDQIEHVRVLMADELMKCEKAADALKELRVVSGDGKPVATVSSGLMQPHLEPLGGWIPGMLQTPALLASGRQNWTYGQANAIVGRANTVGIVKTAHGVVCGGYLSSAWPSLGSVQDPTYSSFIFALVNPELPVPVRYKMTGAHAEAAYRGPSYLQWGYPAAVCLVSGHGIAGGADCFDIFEVIPGGVCRLVDASDEKQKVPIETWEFWHVL